MLRVLVLAVCIVTSVSATVVRVYPGKRGEIRTAIREAKAGDTLVISTGIYHETGIPIDKQLVIVADGHVRVQAAAEGNIFIITASQVTVRGIEFYGVTRSFISDFAAIKIESVSACNLLNNRFTDCFFGIHAARLSGGSVTGNIFAGRSITEANSGNAIHLWYCRNLFVKNNSINGHRDGIYLEFCRKIQVAENISRRNLRYGLHFMFSDSCQYSKNIFENNGAGVAVMYSNSITMRQNTFRNNLGPSSYGLLLKDIRNGQVYGNQFEGNTTGILMDGALRLQFTHNIFWNNGWAVRAMANSEGNTFVRNNFIENTFDITTNTRDNKTRFELNYWDEYRGYDINKDGVGDVPHYPVSLFSMVIENNPVLIVLLRSFFVNMINLAERAAPALTPANLFDPTPNMRPNI